MAGTTGRHTAVLLRLLIGSPCRQLHCVPVLLQLGQAVSGVDADIKQSLCELYGCEQSHVKGDILNVIPQCTSEMSAGRWTSLELWFCRATLFLGTQTVFREES